MFARLQDSRNDTEIALDDFTDLGLECEHDKIEAIDTLEEKLYWYKILLAGMREKKKENWIRRCDGYLKIGEKFLKMEN